MEVAAKKRKEAAATDWRQDAKKAKTRRDQEILKSVQHKPAFDSNGRQEI